MRSTLVGVSFSATARPVRYRIISDDMAQKSSARGAKVLLPVVVVGALLMASHNIMTHEGRHSDCNEERPQTPTRVERPPPRIRSTSAPRGRVEAYVISNGGERLANFRDMNVGMDDSAVAWWPATDGSAKSALERWAALTDTPVFDPATKPLAAGKIEDKGDGSPHSIGVHLSHWHLAKTLEYRVRGHGDATTPSSFSTVRI